MDKIRRQIDVSLFDGINVLDVAGPAQAFSTAYIDGDKAVVKMYGQEVQATAQFKYLGVILQAGGGAGAHLDQRLSAVKKAC